MKKEMNNRWNRWKNISKMAILNPTILVTHIEYKWLKHSNLKARIGRLNKIEDPTYIYVCKVRLKVKGWKENDLIVIISWMLRVLIHAH